jgi:AhpD family alkylhydroperoxidase
MEPSDSSDTSDTQPESGYFDKPVLTLGALLGHLPGMPAHLVRVVTTSVGYPISGPLRERIMLAVTAVNRCFYCQLAHTAFARSEGLADGEIQDILAGVDPAEDLGESAALAYVRDLAERGFVSRDAALWGELRRYYTDEQCAAIDSSARVINVANRFGNTFDAARERLSGGCEMTGVSGLDLTVVSSLFAAGAALVSPVVGALMVLQQARKL